MRENGTTVCDLTADSFVNTYLELLAEGHTPELEEFIRRVPEELQEEVFRGIDVARANPPEVENNFFLEPSVELAADAVPKAGIQERIMLRLVPAGIRASFAAEWLIAKGEARRAKAPRVAAFLRSTAEWFQAIAQHAPLREASLGNEPDVVAKRGWIAWRCAGPTLFLGVAFGLPLVVLGGALLLGLAITAATSRRDGEDEVSRRLVNGVLGGATLALGGVFQLGLLTILAIVLSAVFGWPVLAAAAVRALVICATLVCALVTGSGWSPEPWWPEHLVRQG